MNESKKIQQTLKETVFNNPWKTAFFCVVAAIVGLIIVVGARVSSPRVSYKELPVVDISEKSVLELNMNKEQLGRISNYYLENLSDESGLDYRFTLDKEAIIDGTFQIFGYDTHFYLFFEPYVLSDGNIQLEAKSLSVGSLDIPINAMINYISHSIDFPEWVEIASDDRNVILHLNQMTFANGMSIRAEQINLVDDRIQFSLYLPKGSDDKGLNKNILNTDILNQSGE